VLQSILVSDEFSTMAKNARPRIKGTASRKRATAAPAALKRKTAERPSSPAPLSKTSTRTTRKVQPAVVGIGASAGGLEALTRLLSTAPSDAGMAFVVIQHLDPKHESMLAGILGRATSMPVHEVADGMRVSPDTVFVIPPNRNMTVDDGAFKLTPYRRVRGWHMPIDDFFESLAAAYGPRSVAVVLSGAASDGTAGLRRIKAEGGITFAQDEASARFPEMPRAAIQSGFADFVFPPERIGEELAAIGRHPAMREAPHDDSAPIDPLLDRILATLRTETGVDFSAYRKTTIRRRIRRRMILRKIGRVDEYADYLRQNRGEEIPALFEDILITVTSFFRDPETFELLARQVFPKLLKDRPVASPIRIWIAGCSTGEEVYSIAIALFEAMTADQGMLPVQIFATDISESALRRARAGVYPLSIESDVSPDRLRRFFVREENGYRIVKSIRDVCIFARQDLAADPPFSNLDLISCRNLLIYLEPPLQKTILPLFHYSLKPGGFLLLGASETIRGFERLFDAHDKLRRLFVKRGDSTTRLPHLQRRVSPRDMTPPPLPRRDGTPARDTGGAGDIQRRAEQVLLGRFSPPGAIVDGNLTIVQFRGETRDFLGSPSGSASFNILKMAREGLLLPLKDALAQSRRTHERARKTDVRVRRDGGGYRAVDLEVMPLHDGGNHFLVVFEDRDISRPGRETAAARRKKEGDRTIGHLEQELAATKEYLQSIIEGQEATNEELTSANEEILSSNEELQSTNEELETAKEELQSTNEELTTVNDELQTRNRELAAANNDLLNVFTSVNIPMVIVDAAGAIRRYTPLAEKLLNLIPGDIGRPLRDLKTNVEVPDLDELVRGVIRDVEGREREIQDAQGQWYLMRVRPYRTSENRIEGAVIVFLDIDPIKLGLEQVTRARDYAEALVETVNESLVVLDENLRVRRANQPFYRAFDTSPLRTEDKPLSDLPGWNAPRLRALLEPVVHRGDAVANVEWETRAGDRERTFLLSARPIRLPSETRPLFLLVIQDVTERKTSEKKIRDSETRYRRLFEKAREGILLIDGATGRVVDVNPHFTEMVGYPADAILGRALDDLPALAHPGAPAAAWDFEGGARIPPEMEIPLIAASGGTVWAHRVCSGYASDGATMVQCNLRDVTRARLLQAELWQSQKLESMGALAGGIAHDFNNILGILAGYVGALRRSPENAGKGAENLVSMETAIERGAALVRQLLAFARRGEGDAFGPVDVNAVIQELASMLRETFPKTIEFSVELAPKLPAALGDASQLHQALLNLCVNARDAMPAGGRLSIRTNVTAGDEVRRRFPEAAADRYLTITVSDTGEGMSEEIRRRIFEPFFSTKKEHGGSGLGLAVAYGVVETHGGFIDVESEEKGGSLFRFHLPAEEKEGSAPGGRKERARPPVSTGKGSEKPAGTGMSGVSRAGGKDVAETILVVEDEPELRNSMRALIESEGYRVLTAADGEDAVRIYREHARRIRLVVSDLQMPSMGGWDTFLRIRECDAGAKVILASGHVEPTRRAEMSAAGVKAYLMKPIRPDEMIRTIRRVLDS
jgi:two-component system CheB/CheR fusion protein